MGWTAPWENSVCPKQFAQLFPVAWRAYYLKIVIGRFRLANHGPGTCRPTPVRQSVFRRDGP